jgi:hypothetical protein
MSQRLSQSPEKSATSSLGKSKLFKLHFFWWKIVVQFKQVAFLGDGDKEILSAILQLVIANCRVGFKTTHLIYHFLQFL